MRIGKKKPKKKPVKPAKKIAGWKRRPKEEKGEKPPPWDPDDPGLWIW